MILLQRTNDILLTRDLKYKQYNNCEEINEKYDVVFISCLVDCLVKKPKIAIPATWVERFCGVYYK